MRLWGIHQRKINWREASKLLTKKTEHTLNLKFYFTVKMTFHVSRERGRMKRKSKMRKRRFLRARTPLQEKSHKGDQSSWQKIKQKRQLEQGYIRKCQSKTSQFKITLKKLLTVTAKTSKRYKWNQNSKLNQWYSRAGWVDLKGK